MNILESYTYDTWICRTAPAQKMLWKFITTRKQGQRYIQLIINASRIVKRIPLLHKIYDIKG